jgi:hypothetical protein
MIAIVGGLGDDLANTKPRLPGANSPYAILTHCLGVMDFWGGQMVAGRKIERDPEAEFRSSGSVDGLIEKAQSARSWFEVAASIGTHWLGPASAATAGHTIGVLACL